MSQLTSPSRKSAAIRRCLYSCSPSTFIQAQCKPSHAAYLAQNRYCLLLLSQHSVSIDPLCLVTVTMDNNNPHQPNMYYNYPTHNLPTMGHPVNHSPSTISDSAHTPTSDKDFRSPSLNSNGKRPSELSLNIGRKKPRSEEDDEDDAEPNSPNAEKAKPTRGSRWVLLITGLLTFLFLSVLQGMHGLSPSENAMCRW